MPLLVPVLQFFAPLFKRLDTYLVLLIVLLALAFNHARHRADAAEAALAARPAVSDTARKETDLHVERGKVTVVERFLPAPPASAACPDPKPQLAERVTTRDPSVIDRTTQAEQTHAEAPACPAAAAAPWRYAGVLADPTSASKLVGLYGGVTLKDRLDLGVGLRFSPHAEIQGQAGIRF